MINPLLKTVGSITTISDGKSILPFYSSRGITHAVGSIGGAKVQRRTVNFELVNLALTRSQKYTLTLSAKDIRPPSRDDVWPGKSVWVGCAWLLSYATIGGSPARSVVSGSTFVGPDGFTYYRPLINFMIGELPRTFDEWNATSDWHLDMEEI